VTSLTFSKYVIISRKWYKRASYVDVDVEVFAIALLLMLSSEVLVSAVWK